MKITKDATDNSKTNYKGYGICFDERSRIKKFDERKRIKKLIWSYNN